MVMPHFVCNCCGEPGRGCRGCTGTAGDCGALLTVVKDCEVKGFGIPLEAPHLETGRIREVAKCCLA